MTQWISSFEISVAMGQTKIPITTVHAQETLVNCIFAVLGIGCRVEVKIDGGVRQIMFTG